MTARGLLRPISLSRDAAWRTARVLRKYLAMPTAPSLAGTPFAPLPEFEHSLFLALRRGGVDRSKIRLYLSRATGTAAFHFLRVLDHPQLRRDRWSADEWRALDTVALELAAAVGARRGPPRTTAAKAREKINSADSCDERWVQRLLDRIAADDALARTPVADLPPALRAWLDS